ncbi:MAG: SBBP repeat-containing protein [Bacteroidetes bacterium]|nr:SBBP repeat-containing protein [Bacteroidota bacterium]
MKKFLLAVVVSLLSTAIHAQSVKFDWAKSIGGSADDNGESITVDLFGNVLITGYYRGTADFDPGASTFNLSSNGDDDIFIQKLDSAGNFIWAKSIGGTLGDRGHSIATDIWGNVYITGWYQGTVDFDPGASTFNLTVTGAVDVFIQKLDPAGNFIWAKSMGGSSADVGRSITIDASGNVLTTGYYLGVVDFDPGATTFNLSAIGQAGIFVQKLDTGGNFLWAKSMSGSSWDEGNSVTTDALGNVLITGVYGSTVDFDPSGAVFNLTANGQGDVFIQKLDSGGNFLWAKSMGGTDSDVGYSITTDTAGNVLTTGYYRDTADFDPGAATFNLISNGGFEVFIHKLDTGGNFIWAKSVGGTSNDFGYSITNDISGNVFITGFYQDTADFNPGAATFNLISKGSSDIFIHKLDTGGKFIFAKSMGGTSLDNGSSITIDSVGNVYVTGQYYNTADFDPSAAIFNLSSIGGLDVFIQKLSPCVSNTGTDIITTCDYYTWIDGNTYTVSNNTATHALTNAAGCDSVVALNLTIAYSTTSTDVVAVCDSLIWIDSITYAVSNNTATYILTNAAGCDSIITLNLTINNNGSIDVITACDSYTWSDGNTYTASNNTATDTFTNAAGCDSVVTLNLTINTVNVSVTTTDPSITANATGALYQWLDCNNNYAVITGETAQSFTASVNGDYAVEVTQNNCTDTSTCVNISKVGIVENTFFNSVSIYPNPNSGLVTIDLGNLKEVSIKVFSVSGQLIYQVENINTQIHQFEFKEAPGVYIIEVSSKGEKQQYKLVKE